MADEESVEARKRLDATLANFRSGRLNCLVATQVLEEGMDVRRCNLVVRFDKVQTLRSYVQGKGRARARPALHVIMCPSEGSGSYERELDGYRRIVDRAIDLCHETFDGQVTDEDKEEIEVYLSDPGKGDKSPRVDSLKAVGLIHRYVQCLPTDRFTDLQPYWNLESKVTYNSINLSFVLGSTSVSCSLIPRHWLRRRETRMPFSRPS